MSNKPCALVSVSDKRGISECCKNLVRHGWSILATGGTAALLKNDGIEVTELSSVTGFPEILGGRVKTLHPVVYGALLARRADSAHRKDMESHQIPDIRMVIVNLYPFQETVKDGNAPEQDAIENIDIGGVSLIRAAAKNYEDVLVVTHPDDYSLFSKSSPENIGVDDRRRLAMKAWEAVAEYDLAIASHFKQRWQSRELIPLMLEESARLVYGENPHQKGKFYRDRARDNQPVFREISGRDLSYNNYQDVSSALFTIRQFDRPACAVVKHNNPCGAAESEDLNSSIRYAWQGDSVSAFGSVIAVNRSVDLKTMEFYSGKFVEILCAPEFGPEVQSFCAEKKPKLRLIQYDPAALAAFFKNNRMVKSVVGGYLVQDHDEIDHQRWDVVTKSSFSPGIVDLAKFGIKVNKCVTSNTISLVTETAGVFWQAGMGAGQPNRVGALEHIALPLFDRNNKELASAGGISIEKTVLISDAFFPFPDSIEIAAKHGIRYIVQPGGSKKDSEVIAACDARGIAMVLTGTRHFRH